MQFTLFTALAILVLAQIVYTREEWKCEPGVPYKENKCNNCFCGESRVLACTEKACLNPSNKELFNCKEGTTSQQGCNNCVCVKGWGTICTNREC